MSVKLERVAPAEIERRSFELIERELPHPLDPALAPIVKRVIHATADFDYADNLVFSDGAVAAGLNALREGAVIVTDTTMAQAGINKKALAALGGETRCFIADEAWPRKRSAAASRARPRRWTRPSPSTAR